jgi:energy-coupling factor transporter ATP-binding protein EcfA2
MHAIAYQRTKLFSVVLDNYGGMAYNGTTVNNQEAPMADIYRAAKNRSQNREGWCILFRHPVRRNARGSPLRVRRGLRTRDDGEADRLVSQMNQLLSDESYWTPAARDRASREFDPRIVSAFYHGLEPKIEDAAALRDSAIPLPGPDEGYARALFLGPTGAGKTTLVRQIIGSHPKRDRFPSTSTAKTTVFDVEVVTVPGPYRAVVSFLSKDQVRRYIDECVAAAVYAAAAGDSEEDVLRRLLEHTEQRFRLSYLLGTLQLAQGEAEDNEDGEEDALDETAPEVSEEERGKHELRLRAYFDRVTQIAVSIRVGLADQLEIADDSLKPEDRDAFLELLEDTLGEDEGAQSLVDDILDDVESRFEVLHDGELERDHSEWPVRWLFSTDSRDAFVKAVNRFSSNYAPNFGRLLTPLVAGLRVAGPFSPNWYEGVGTPRLVLMDGEGLGHTPDSAASLPTALTRRYEQADVIVLVDNATQPMGGGALAALRSIGASGHEAKLALVFTHFDQVKGDNLPTELAKRNHVRSSLENAIASIDISIGGGVGRSLRRGLDGRVFFVGRIDGPPEALRSSTRAQLKKLLEVARAASAPLVPIEAVPVYDTANLVLAATAAARHFLTKWNAQLAVEHWTRVKALTRRFAELTQDHYDKLMPAADLIQALMEQARGFIAAPRSWRPANASEEQRLASVARVLQEFHSRVHTMVRDRLWLTRVHQWQLAYDRRGLGSGNLRKRDVRSIYEAAAPVPDSIPVPDASEFLDAVRALFREAAEAAGAKVGDAA